MRKQVIVWVVVLMAFLAIVSLGRAASLVCDPQAGVEFYDVEIDGVIVENHPAEQDGSALFNVDALAKGQHRFRLRAYDTLGGWASDWSVPLDATKPGNPGNVRVINQ